MLVQEKPAHSIHKGSTQYRRTNVLPLFMFMVGLRQEIGRADVEEKSGKDGEH